MSGGVAHTPFALRGRKGEGARSAAGAPVALLAMLCALIAVVLTPLGAAAASATQAAWTDRTVLAAHATAGTWQVTPRAPVCTPVDASGKVVAGAACSVTGVTVTQWSDNVNRVRDYYVSVQLSGPATAVPLVTVDLSTAAGGGAWAWGTAVSVSTDQYTTPSGYACAELPVLRATGPSNWGSSFSMWVRVYENAATAPSTGRTCR